MSCLGEESGLTDPRRALDEEEACSSIRGCTDCCRERVELPLPFEQTPAAHLTSRSEHACAHWAILGLFPRLLAEDQRDHLRVRDPITRVDV